MKSSLVWIAIVIVTLVLVFFVLSNGIASPLTLLCLVVGLVVVFYVLLLVARHKVALANKAKQDLAQKIMEKTDQELLDMIAAPDGWQRETLEAAREELRNRKDDIGYKAKCQTHKSSDTVPSISSPLPMIKQIFGIIVVGISFLIIPSLIFVLTAGLLYVAVSATPLKQWLVPNYHEFSSFDEGSYQQDDVVFPGEYIIFNLKLKSLQGAIRIEWSEVTTPGYDLNVWRLQQREINPEPLSSSDTVYYKGVPPIYETGKILVRLPSDERLYGKSLPIHYSAFVSRPVVMEDRHHYYWGSTNVDGMITIKIGTKEQVRRIKILDTLMFAVSLAITICVIIWFLRNHQTATPGSPADFVLKPFRFLKK